MSQSNIKVAVHKFSSCDGCQLAFLNMGAELLTLSNLVEIVHFVEAGMQNENAQVDIAFIEGSISTAEEMERIQRIRKNSHYLITIGACATSGGIQALRNMNDHQEWLQSVYAEPEYISTLDKVRPISELVRVDFEIWGCPVSSAQVKQAISSLLQGVTPKDSSEKVCMECKRSQTICRMVADQEACMGPVTKAGCGAICPQFGRGCYACYGPAKDKNATSLANRFEGLGLMPDDIARHFVLIHNNVPSFNQLAVELQKRVKDHD